ncbi:MAG: carboxypeptidase regulatory-like domain-containing protein, partial [Acidobacteria bacterium]|nr:carboxypeptidase regulatory-like domain-containing protein [Acidobacteriota bacterium]
PSQWAGKDKLALAPIIVTPIWWGLWLRWCRTFVIQGRVVCADGSPVPGAEVHALDVDFFWWWSSMSQVGPTVITDATGHFTIKFRWCCGWWPWWWWRLRRWSLNQQLLDKIRPIMKLNTDSRIPEPSPVVSFNFASLNPQPLPPQPALGGTLPVTTSPVSPTLGPITSNVVDPTTIPALRDRLLRALPQVPELERLRIWPWFPWTPWLDCSPDIIFRVTQNCGGQNKVIVNENIFQTRFDIPTNLSVTLTANGEACCLPPHNPDPVGDCALITGVCGDPGIIAGNIGGNSAHPAGPDGYANPGSRDNPFSEAVTLWGQLGISPQSDYYEIEYKPHTAPPTAWASVPPAALAGFSRGYFDSTQPWPNQWFYPGFSLKPLGTKLVYESRHHYEATHPPANWGNVFSGRSWFMNVNELASLQTFGNFPDGTYDFRVRGYKSLANGDPDPNDPGVVLNGCGNHQENNLLVLRIDNRIVGPQQPGTVHIDTTEPDCGISLVKLGNNLVQPCGAEHLQPNTPLQVDFFCSDPDGHLDHYELRIMWGLGNVRNLLTVPGATLTGIGAGVQPGPDDPNALAQGAVRPTWKGGNMRLTIPNAALVFPVTCCYLIELTVWKRNIVNCGSVYYNQMHYSFTVTV